MTEISYSFLLTCLLQLVLTGTRHTLNVHGLIQFKSKNARHVEQEGWENELRVLGWRAKYIYVALDSVWDLFQRVVQKTM